MLLQLQVGRDSDVKPINETDANQIVFGYVVMLLRAIVIQGYLKMGKRFCSKYCIVAKRGRPDP